MTKQQRKTAARKARQQAALARAAAEARKSGSPLLVVGWRGAPVPLKSLDQLGGRGKQKLMERFG